MTQTMCTHVNKWIIIKSDTCWNYSRNWWGRGIKEINEGVNSSMIYLIHCKNLCKCHNVPPPSTTIKEKNKYILKKKKNHFKWIKPGSKGPRSLVFPHILKLDLKDKCIHKYIYDHIYADIYVYIYIYIERETMILIVVCLRKLCGGERGKENDSEWIILKQCICVWRRCDVMYWKLLNNRGVRW
jgi:hypothetical protein